MRLVCSHCEWNMFYCDERGTKARGESHEAIAN